MLKISLLFTKYTKFKVNKSKILAIENAKFLGFYFISTGIHGEILKCALVYF